jgi:serine/threonine protein phosphatase PrpC
MHFECASRTHVGLRRKINEDSLLVDCEQGLWAVADGMGGHEAGEVASTMVTDALRCLPQLNDCEELAAQALEALRDVNRQLLALAQSRAQDEQITIGTTIVGLAISNGSFNCFWMGDSRAYLVRGGEIRRLTHDHSLVQNLVDAGMLKAEEAETHENANLITRAVGVSEKFEMDLVRGDARAGDQFLLASDGLTRVIPDEQLARALTSRMPHDAADNLIEAVMARGAPDNVSLIIVKLL